MISPAVEDITLKPMNKEKQHKTIPFSGKLMTDDPASVGANFRTLTNLRYTDTHVRGIQGMTKINSSVMNATYLKTRSAFHFKKPGESHVLAQAYNTGLTASQILENTTAIPSAGNFSATALWTDSSGSGRGRFSYAPDGQMIYCNGVDSCIWGGNEMGVGAFITSSAAITTGGATDPRDLTSIANNTKTDSDNLILIGGGKQYPYAQSDTYVKATSKYSTSFWPYYATDPTKSLTGSNATGAWGSANGTTTNQRFHIDLGSAKVIRGIYYENHHSAGAETDIGVQNFTLWGSNTAASFADLTYATDTGWTELTVSQNTFDQHAAADAADPKYITVTNTIAYRYYAFKFADNYGDAALMGVRRIELMSSETSMASSLYWLIGSTRPLKGVKYYVNTGNAIASTLTGSVWNGEEWSSLTLTDNTDTGASLAVTGTVTFSSTVDTAKPKYLEGYFLYWYQFALSDGNATLYNVTVDAPFQGMVDLWDGVYRQVSAFYKYTTTYLDNSVNVLEDDYDASTSYTYCDLSSMAAFSTPNNCLEIGFGERVTAIRFFIPPDYTNSTAATTASVDFWNGAEYTTVGTIVDGTSEGSISFAKSGVISWNSNGLANETKKSVSNSSPFYYYRVRFNKAMDASVRVSFVTGVTAQRDLSYYKFPVFAQGRVLLCCDMSGERNKAVASAKYLPHVYNGTDSVDIYFGESGELTCGVELFSLYGSSLYSIVLMFKDNETWVMAGQDIDEWANNTFLVSSSIGCPAPQTLKTINLSAEPGTGVNRSLAIWQGANGIYMSDGRAPIPIHGDIKAYFDNTDSRCIRASMIGDSVAWVDEANVEYHIKVASGSSATSLNTELVYDVGRNKWFIIDRSVDLQCGIPVHDTDGNPYNYGFLDTGYMERLEYGTTFDGNDIIHTVQFGDIAMSDLAMGTRIHRAKLITMAKTTTANNITCTHYSDTKSTGTDKTMSPANAGYRLAKPYFDEKLDGEFHSFKFAMTTDNETIGFEPMALVLTFSENKED